jgi:ribonuclease BN (tRNA processing enzyme)
VKLTIVGCSGSVPGPDSAASSYLVEQDGFRILLDLGSGAFGALQRHVDPAGVDAVVLSHLHADHCLDLTAMVVHRRHGVPQPLPRIPVLGPSGTHDRLAAAYDPAARGGLRDVLAVAAVEPGKRELGPFRLRFERVNHPVETYAIRVEAGGHVLAYSGDTGVSPGLVAAATGADLLLCEASVTDGLPHPPDLHLTGQQAGEHATVVRDKAAAAFGGPTELAAAGAAYEL